MAGCRRSARTSVRPIDQSMFSMRSRAFAHPPQRSRGQMQSWYQDLLGGPPDALRSFAGRRVSLNGRSGALHGQGLCPAQELRRPSGDRYRKRPAVQRSAATHRDLSESLQQQTATADVLKVISRSAFDLQTVFDTLISSGVELSGALNGTICLRQGDGYRYLATAGIQSDFANWLADHPPTPGRSSGAGACFSPAKSNALRTCWLIRVACS